MPCNNNITTSSHGKGVSPKKELRLHHQQNSQPKPHRRHPQRPEKVIPTHFLAIPLNTHNVFLSTISAFQDGLLKTRKSAESGTGVRGLDPSIVIDPRRFHLTLGVMALEDEAEMEEVSKSAADQKDGHGRHATGTRSVERLISHCDANTITGDPPTAMSSVHTNVPLGFYPRSNFAATAGTTTNFSSSACLVSSDPSSSTMVSSVATAIAVPTPPEAITRTQIHHVVTTDSHSSPTNPFPKPRTVRSALELLRSLKPQLDLILGTPVLATESDSSAEPVAVSLESVSGAGIKSVPHTARRPVLTVVLDKMHIMQSVAPPKPKAKGKTTLMQTVDGPTIPSLPPSAFVDNNPDVDIWANVMYLAPEENSEQGRKLRLVCDLIHTTFKRAGYLTDTRPLKLHCTVLNTSKRRPSRLRGSPFCYSDVLASRGFELLSHGSSPKFGPGESRRALEEGIQGLDKQSDTMLDMNGSARSPNTSTRAERSSATPTRAEKRWAHVAPVYIDLGADASVGVGEVGLWIMGSRAPNNEYVSCGAVRLG